MRHSNQPSCFIFVLLSLILAGQYCVSADPARLSTFHWGSFQIVKADREVMDGADSSVTIVYRRRVVATVVSADPCDVYQLRLSSRCRPSLIVCTHSQNNSQSGFTTFLFESHGSKVLNVGVILGDDVHFGAGFNYKRQIVLSCPFSSTFELVADFCHACSPADIPLLYGWNGRCYNEITAKFPSASLVRARYYRELYKSGSESADTMAGNGPTNKIDIATYYANMAIVWRGAQAYRWITHNASADDRRWFLAYRSQFDDRIRLAHRSAYCSQQTIYHPSDNVIWF